MRREQFSKDEWGKILADRWDKLDGLVQAGVLDEHPGKAGWNADSAALRKASRDSLPGNVASSKEITDEYAEDDPLATATTSGVTGGPRNGGQLESQQAADELAIRLSGVNVEQRLHMSRIRRIDPAQVRAANALIPGMDRLK